jgi:EAL domain-containing protein (putative c-di-GMP-specific phosphodiesterase class I)
MNRGEIVLRYQPVVRLSDRKPVMVEALARWHRQPRVVGPDQFVPLAERAGLVRALSIIVASRAAMEMAPLTRRLGIGVSLNLPLGLLLQDDLTTWLARAIGNSGMHPTDLAIELTETTPVEEFGRLRRALLRLRQAGYRVLLDDMAMDDGRERLMELPFAACKLDRSIVEALPDSARARRTVQRLVATARRNGQTVIAEGIADARLWQAARGLGVDHAQGFIVGRPLPPEAIPAWWAAWRGGRLG